jgi:hypothetical protein
MIKYNSIDNKGRDYTSPKRDRYPMEKKNDLEIILTKQDIIMKINMIIQVLKYMKTIIIVVTNMITHLERLNIRKDIKRGLFLSRNDKIIKFR